MATAAARLERALPVSYHDVTAAYKRIMPVVNKSPLDFSHHLSPQVGARLYLKKEHLSITSSYKERGALNKLLLLSEEEKKRGVICSSAGNHAQAVSYHSTRLGIDGVIVMPTTTPFVKVDATRRFGGTVVLHGSSFQDAFEKAKEIAEQEKRIFIHAFNDASVVAGQGTVALEMVEQNPFLDSVVVPVGGGGLIAGMAVALRHINPRIKIFGVEAAAMPGMKRSLERGAVERVLKQPTMADGIAIEHVGQIPFEIIKETVDDIVTVEEDEIAAAVLALLEKEKTVLEGSGATGVAALLSNKIKLEEGSNVGIVLTGGNIDMTLLGRIIEKGLVKTGRLARVRVTVSDMPGQLASVCTAIASLGGNIRDIMHERAFLLDTVQYTQPVITIETRDFAHITAILDKLREGAFRKVKLETPEP